MERAIGIMALLLSITSGHAQDLDCASVRTGSFLQEIRPGAFAYYERTEEKQVEIVPKLDLVTHYRIRWTDECTYQLFDKEAVKGKPVRVAQPTDTITVHITAIDSAGFSYEATMNYSDQRATGRQERAAAK